MSYTKEQTLKYLKKQAERHKKGLDKYIEEHNVKDKYKAKKTAERHFYFKAKYEKTKGNELYKNKDLKSLYIESKIKANSIIKKIF